MVPYGGGKGDRHKRLAGGSSSSGFRLAVMAFIVAAIGITVISFGGARSFGQCVHNRKRERQYEAIHNYTPRVGVVSSVFRAAARGRLTYSCSLHTINTNQAGVTAIFTVVLAGVSVFQWSAIRRQAGIMTDQHVAMRDTLTKMDEAKTVSQAQVRAYVTIVNPELKFQQARLWGVESIFPTISFVAVNHGASPALDFRWSVVIVYASSPDKSLRGDMSVIEAGDQFGVSIGRETRQSFSRHQLSATLNIADRTKLMSDADGNHQVAVTIRTMFNDIFGYEIVADHNFEVWAPIGKTGIPMPLESSTVSAFSFAVPKTGP